ncbi:hypothetical protein EDB19DRAFT_2021804 [Suillus lakei]|nr:hypothetical protein EDB19DRAFT_2021804 [Suillus lakei]
MAANSAELMWGPGVIGCVIATVLYGIAFGQYIFYLRSFPQDSKRFKSFLMVVFCFGTIEQYALVGVYWSILISCRRNTSLECTTKLPCLGYLRTAWIMFAVQCFYAHRVWIITEHNRLLTGIISVLAATSFVFGLITSGLVFYTRNPVVLFGKKWCQVSGVTGALCDIFITGTVWWFLRPARTGNVRPKPNYLNKLTQIFVNMGLFTCIVAITLAAALPGPGWPSWPVLFCPAWNTTGTHLFELDDGSDLWPGSMLGSQFANGNNVKLAAVQWSFLPYLPLPYFDFLLVPEI